MWVAAAAEGWVGVEADGDGEALEAGDRVLVGTGS